MCQLTYRDTTFSLSSGLYVFTAARQYVSYVRLMTSNLLLWYKITSKCVYRAAGMKVVRTTVLEMKVLTYLEREYLELRERMARKRAEMAKKLQDMGYGEPSVPFLHLVSAQLVHGLHQASCSDAGSHWRRLDSIQALMKFLFTTGGSPQTCGCG